MRINHKSLEFGKFLTLRNSRGISKRGQGLSLNVIIVAAIALIVLVVLIFILTERLGKFGEGLDALEDCKGQGGTCYKNCPTGSTPISKCSATEVCCVET